MPITVPMDCVFRVAAGPRLGFGHLVRCRSMARALGVTPRVSIRGSRRTRALASRLGWTVIDAGRVLSPAPALLVVDDPNGAETARWVRRARAIGVPVASIHDAGLAWHARGDLGIDGSLTPRRPARGGADLTGPRVALLDPRMAPPAARVVRREARRLVVALGGGAHVFALVRRLTAAIASRCPQLEIRVARGFTARRLPVIAGVRWIDAPDGLAGELTSADVALVAGGVTLQEACALGTPAVAVAVVGAQRAAVRAAAAAGAVVDGGGPRLAPRRIADVMARLAADPQARRRCSAAGRALVDGRGAARVAIALQALATRRSTGPGREARRAA